jgi:hypothetical protein
VLIHDLTIVPQLEFDYLAEEVITALGACQFLLDALKRG